MLNKKIQNKLKQEEKIKKFKTQSEKLKKLTKT